MKRCLLLLIILLGGVSMTLAQQDNFVQVTGRLVQGTSDGTALPATIPVELQVINRQRQVVQVLTVLTAPDGSFEFEGVPISESYLYVFLATHAGLQQRTPVLTADQLEFVTFLLYDLTDSLDDLEITSARLQIEDVSFNPELGTTLVMLMELETRNRGDRIIYVEDAEPPYSFSFELPVGTYGASEITPQESSSGHLYIDDQSDGVIPVVYDLAPLIPHWYQPNRIHITYLLSFGAEVVIDQPFPVSVAELEVWMPAGLETVQSDDLELIEAARQTSSGRYDIYQGGPFEAGDSLILTASGQVQDATPTPTPVVSDLSASDDEDTSSGMAYVLCGGAMLVVVGGGSWLWYRRRKKLEELLQYDRDQ